MLGLVEMIQKNMSILYFLYIMLFVMLVIVIYNIVKYVKDYNGISGTVKKTYGKLVSIERLRNKKNEYNRSIHGVSNSDLMYFITEDIVHSGLKDKFNWLTAEIFIVINALVLGSVLAIGTILSNIAVGIIASIVTFTIIQVAINMAIRKRERKIESKLFQFMNTVDNFSNSTDDLINIFDNASKYIDEPIKSMIVDTVIEARNTGDEDAALQSLSSKVRNRHFKVLIENLGVSSKFETNYSEIIEDCRDIFRDYIKSEKERRTIRKNGVLEIAVMMVCGVLCIYLISMISVNNVNILELLYEGGALGNAILVYLIISLLITCYIFIFKLFKE